MPYHIPVLLHEALDLLTITPGAVVLDATLGEGGHSKDILEVLNGRGRLIAMDADAEAITRAQKRFVGVPNLTLIHANFRLLKDELARCDVRQLNAALFDLGMNSAALEKSGKGFSFLRDEPLLMTFGDPRQALFTAQTIVNEWAEDSIREVLVGYGEERYAAAIARRIVEHRRGKVIMRTLDLVAVINEAVPARYRRARLHPATKTFQALRIAVNDEIGALVAGFTQAWELLAPGGRMVIITFHGIEGRTVKRLIREKRALKEGKALTPHAVKPSRAEVILNPRARSAKLYGIKKN